MFSLSFPKSVISQLKIISFFFGSFKFAEPCSLVPLSNVSMHLWYGENDYLVVPVDSARLIRQLGLSGSQVSKVNYNEASTTRSVGLI